LIHKPERDTPQLEAREVGGKFTAVVEPQVEAPRLLSDLRKGGEVSTAELYRDGAAFAPYARLMARVTEFSEGAVRSYATETLMRLEQRPGATMDDLCRHTLPKFEARVRGKLI
jgi:hypothetical protein